MGEGHVAKIAPYLSRGRPEQGGTGRASRSEKRLKKLPPGMVPGPGVGQWASAGSPSLPGPGICGWAWERWQAVGAPSTWTPGSYQGLPKNGDGPQRH